MKKFFFQIASKLEDCFQEKKAFYLPFDSRKVKIKEV